MAAGTTEYWFGWTGRPEDAAQITCRRGLPPGRSPRRRRSCCASSATRRSRRGPAACCSAATLAAVGGFEESFRGMYEDQAFLAKVCLTVPVVLSGECVARYRQHAESCYSRSRAGGEAEAAEERYLRWLATWMARHRHAEGPEWEALRAILWRHRHPLLHRLVRRLPAALRPGAPASR